MSLSIAAALAAVALLMSVQTILVVFALRRLRAEAVALRRVQLTLALHLVGDPLRQDPDFTRLLDRYRTAPRELDEVDRIRARSWNSAASRVYALALGEAEPSNDAGWFLPPFGDDRRSHVSDVPTLDGLTKLDPEFAALVNALRDR